MDRTVVCASRVCRVAAPRSCAVVSGNFTPRHNLTTRIHPHRTHQPSICFGSSLRSLGPALPACVPSPRLSRLHTSPPGPSAPSQHAATNLYHTRDSALIHFRAFTPLTSLSPSPQNCRVNWSLTWTTATVLVARDFLLAPLHRRERSPRSLSLQSFRSSFSPSSRVSSSPGFFFLFCHPSNLSPALLPHRR